MSMFNRNDNKETSVSAPEKPRDVTPASVAAGPKPIQPVAAPAPTH